MASLKPAQPPIVVGATKPTAAVIWLHGLGDTGHGWADVGPQLASVVPHARFIFPTAPTRPVTLNGGMAMTAWFDLTSLSDINSEEDGAGIEASVAYVETLVEAEVAAGVDRSRIVVAGFSQGGAIALTAGLRAPSPFAGVVALSTWLPMAKSYPAALGAGGVATPVIMCHGTQDMVVRTEYGTRSAEALKTLGVTADWRTFRMAHSAVPEELSLVADWLKKRLAA
jgi:predicted esterase